MALRVTNVPNPAAGADWQFTVPGQYVYDIVNLTATFWGRDYTITPAVDSSGNGRDGVYQLRNSHNIWGFPGIVGGDTCVHFSGEVPFSFDGARLAGPGVIDINNDFTIVIWIGNARFDSGGFNINLGATSPPFDFLDIGFGVGPGGTSVFQSPASTLYQAPAVSNGSEDVMIALRCSGGSFDVLLNGSFALTPTTDLPLTPTAATLYNFILGFNSFQFGDPVPSMDEFSFHQSALSDATLDGIYAAAASSFTDYTAAVLAESPEAYYHLDDEPNYSTQQRYTSLVVTNGTATLARFTSGLLSYFDGPTTYTYTPNVSNVIDAGAQQLIGIPRLILPPGYTIGSLTDATLADIDQWSDVTIWWDDSLSVGLTAPRRPTPYADLQIL